MKKIERIFHHYKKWEDYPSGFYNNCSGVEKGRYINSVVEMFSDKETTREYMLKAVDLWVYSCEHNLTNDSINKIAYIGQAACCIYCGAPSIVTREAWGLLSKDIQDRSDKIAEEVLKYWEIKNKRIQLCLNLD